MELTIEKKHDTRTPHITRLLEEWTRGNRDAFERIIPIVYDELHKIARHYLGAESKLTLQPTVLINEVYIRLVSSDNMRFSSRVQFFAFAGETMRRILVEHARTRLAAKRGGGRPAAALESIRVQKSKRDLDLATLVALDKALDDLAAIDPLPARIVTLRFFAGLTNDEIAQAMGFSLGKIKQEWRFAKKWLRRELRGD